MNLRAWRAGALLARTGLAGSVLLACTAHAQEGWGWRQGGPRTPSRFAGSTDAVQVTLLDAYSGEPIADRDVRANRDTGIRCAIAPCPSEAEDWRGRSDARGRIAIPAGKLFRETYLSIETYAQHSVEAARETAEGPTLDLVPNGMASSTKPLQLLDAATGAPLSLVIVGVGNARRSTELVTSPVGYLFIDHEYIYTADTAVVVFSPQGYRSVRLDLQEHSPHVLRVTRQASAPAGRAHPKR